MARIENLTLGSTPWEEDCAQVGRDDYEDQARKEGNAFIGQLKRAFPEAEAKGVTFRLKSYPHDFGSYKEVVAVYDADQDAAVEIAFHIEAHTPGTWDAEAKAELARRPR